MSLVMMFWKFKNKDKETRQSWVLRHKTTFQKVKSKDTAFQTLKQEKIWWPIDN